MDAAEQAAHVERTVNLLDHASRQSDRWLFLALLVIGLVTVALLVRYFMRQFDKLQSEIVSVRTAFQDYLKGENAEMVQVVSRNTIVIERNNLALDLVQRKLTS